MAVERQGAATLRGNPFTVVGKELKPGDTAPNFSLVGPGNSDVTLQSTAGKVRILSTVPSLDTPVCSTETQKWEKQRSDLGGIEMITASMDLPPAQARWTNEHGIEHVVASAHKNEQFATDYGVLLKDLRLLQRAVFVIGKDDKVKYTQYVTEITEEPDYDAAIAAAKQAAG
ncbi:MAG: thiol peroxidase [Chloroflexi bacterium]|nr:thiol peroxidase [Chloroflexota bacterium]